MDLLPLKQHCSHLKKTRYIETEANCSHVRTLWVTSPCTGTLLMMCTGGFGGLRGLGGIRQDSVNSDLQLRTDISKQWCLIIYLKRPLANGCPMVCKPWDHREKTLAKKKKEEKAELFFFFTTVTLNLSTFTIKQLIFIAGQKLLLLLSSQQLEQELDILCNTVKCYCRIR